MNRIEMPPRSQPPSSGFEKVLRAFETGDFAYTEVLAQLQQELATGTPARDLLEILERRELIAPLPDYAHAEVLGLLNEAMARAAATGAAPADARNVDSDAAAPTAGRSDAPAKPTAASQAPVFEKVLGAFDTGGFTFADVTVQLKRLLAAGTPPADLLEILRRRESIEPLPDYAHVQILGLLHEAMGGVAKQAADATPPAARLPISTAPSRAGASAPPPVSTSIRSPTVAQGAALSPARTVASLTGSVRSLEEQIARQNADYEALARSHERIRDAEMAAETRIAALTADLQAARAALDLERRATMNEARALQESLAARDATLLQLRGSLGERDSQLAALQQEHARIVPVLEARAKMAATLEAELQAAHARAAAVDADWAASKAREIDKALAQSIATAESARSRSEAAQREAERYQMEARRLKESLAARDAEIAEVRRTLAGRETEFAARQSELTARETELAELREEQAMLQRAHAALRGDHAALQQEHAALRPEHASLQQEHAALRRDYAALRQEHTTLRQAHAAAVPALEARAGHIAQLEAELRAARAKAETTASEARAGQDAAASLGERLKRSEASLNAARTELAAGQAERDQLRSDVDAVHATLNTHQALLEQARTASNANARRVAELQAGAQGVRPADVEDSRSEDVPVFVDDAAAADAGYRPATAAQVKTEAPSFERARAPKPLVNARVLGVCAALAGLAALAWIIAHRVPAPAPAPVPAVVAVPAPGKAIRDCPTCPTMTVLPAGRFKQGSPVTDGGAAPSEKPLHVVAIGRPFAMSTTAVTVDEFREFIAASGQDMQGCDTYDGEWKHRPKNNWKDPGFPQTGTHPVTCVSWNDARSYAYWLSAKTGHHYRLPSASEWEYAARAGGEAVIPWSGDGSGACDHANVADQNAARRYPGWQAFACDDGYVHTAPVGSFKPNSFGLNDLLGNVFQWTEDCWNADYSGAPVDGSARTDGNCSEHELRGGSWFSTPAYVRANYRNHFAADYRASSVGIRLVRDIEQ